MVKRTYWNLVYDTLMVFVVNENNESLLLATVNFCNNKTKSELDKLANEIVYEHFVGVF